MKKIVIGVIIIALIIGISYVLNFYGDNSEYTASMAEKTAKEWIQTQSPTYLERGGENLTHEYTKKLENESFEVVFNFQIRQEGYGSLQEGEMNAQVIVPRRMRLTVEQDDVKSAITDEVFDEVKNQMIDQINADTQEVNLFFVDVEGEKEDITPISKDVTLQNGVEKSTLLALLEGVPAEEKEEGYSTAIPEETELLSFEIKDKVVIVNFNSQLQPGGGSARITNIKEQIQATLKQFNSVEEVEILVEGEEESLQP